MLSSLLFLASAGQAPLALDRFASFIQKANTLSVDVKLTLPGAPEATGKLMFERPRRVRFTMEWGQSVYTFSSTERGVLETELATKRYDEFQPQSKLIGPLSRISQTPEVGFPTVIIEGDLRGMLPSDARIASLGKVQMNGVEVDHVQAVYATQQGRGQTDVFIDSTGRLLKLGQAVDSEQGQLAFTQEYSNYRVNGSLGLESFLGRIPDGFVPHTLPGAMTYLLEGETFPSVALGQKSGAPKALEFSGKGALVAFTTPDCAISARAAPLLSTLRESAKASGYTFVEISDARRAGDAKAHSGASDVRFDPSDTARTAFGVQGTPSLWLVNGNGRVTGYWFGFNPAESHRLEREIKDALEGKREE